MNLIRSIFNHELVSGASYIFLGSITANILAFFLNLFLARNLSYANYGIFASLLSIITLAAIPAGSVNTIVVRFATEYFTRNELDKLKGFYKKIARFMLLFSLLIFLGFAVLSLTVMDFLHLDNIWYVILVGACVSSFYLQTLNIAFLQGLMKFKFISFLTSISGVIKLMVGIVFVFWGLQAFSGLWSIFS